MENQGDNSNRVIFGIKTPTAPRARSGWSPGGRVADTSTMFGPYIDILNDADFSLQRDPKAHDKMMRDCQIRSCLRLRGLTTAARKVEFLPREDSDAGREAAKFATTQWDRVRRQSEVILNILDATAKGSSFQEIMWVPDKETMSWYSEHILPVHKNRFGFTLEGEMVLKTPQDIFYGETLPPRVFIHHRYDPEPASFDNPETESRLYFGQGEFDRIYPWFYWKMLVMRLGFAYLDRLAFPIKVGRYPHRNEDARNQFAQILKDIDHHRYCLYPGGENWDLDFIQTQATGHNVAMEWINYIDGQITKVLLGSTLMQEPGERGSFALGASHTQNVFGALAEFDSRCLCDTLEHTWVRWLFELNSLPKQLAPKVTQASGKSLEVTQLVDIMLLLSERGYPVSVEHIAETTGIRPAREGETLISVDPSQGLSGMQHGPGSPFSQVMNPNDLLNVPTMAGQETPVRSSSVVVPEKNSLSSDRGITTKGAESLAKVDDSEVKRLLLDIAPEKSVSLEDVEKHIGVKAYLYGKPKSEVVKRKLGPIKSSKVAKYASEGRRIKFIYTNLERETKEYDVEPYSYRFRNGFVYLYAYDPKDRHVKSFFVHKVTNILGGRKFKPRWLVEIN